MTERLRRRDAGLARIDNTSGFGSEPAQIEYLDFEALRFFLNCRLRELNQAPGLRYFAGAGLIAA